MFDKIKGKQFTSTHKSKNINHLRERLKLFKGKAKVSEETNLKWAIKAIESSLIISSLDDYLSV